MKKPKQKWSRTRRDFLRDAAATGGMAAIAAIAPGSVAAQSDEPQAPDDKGKGYRLTPHILEYYKTTTS
ncbi:MAG: twin-arginine translocation signal domain-containing protein [Proteobacteria bacterium]|jgi:hypothetical protein|nr:twin-arginine translocation signal domain-containing protein [Pseudomonadota bacterium]MCG6936430.1 twin-arginine translocation signal domain-containing protein [Pseudomonadota bacterium]